jgi:hypothetical protein
LVEPVYPVGMWTMTVRSRPATLNVNVVDPEIAACPHPVAPFGAEVASDDETGAAEVDGADEGVVEPPPHALRTTAAPAPIRSGPDALRQVRHLPPCRLPRPCPRMGASMV